MIKSYCTNSLAHAEAFVSFADGDYQRTFELLVALVVGQTQLVEASVSGWQTIGEGWRRCYLKLRIELLLRVEKRRKFEKVFEMFEANCSTHLESTVWKLAAACCELQ